MPAAGAAGAAGAAAGRAPRGFIWKTFRRSFYRELNPLARQRQPSTCAGCCHLLVLSLLLSIPTTLLTTIRIAPTLAALDLPAALDAATNFWPNGLELVLDASRPADLELRPTPQASKAGGVDEMGQAMARFNLEILKAILRHAGVKAASESSSYSLRRFFPTPKATFA